MLSNAKKLSTVIGLGVLALVAFIVLSQKQFLKPNTKKIEHKTENGITQLSAGEIPNFFPKDFPTQNSAKVTQNMNIESPDGTKSGSQTFVTSKDIAENYQIYKEYFEKAGWTSFDAPDFGDTESKIIIANKEGVRAWVKVAKGPEGQQVTVIFSKK